MLSPAERAARLARDFEHPDPPGSGDDESIGSFTTRRFGEEFTRRVAQPLLGGIHAGDVDRLSLRALFPPLAEADAAGGSVLAVLAARGGRPDPDGAFRGLRGGMGQLPAALTRTLPSTGIRTREPVAWLTRGAPWRVVGASGAEISARAVVLAVPAQVAARLVAPFDGVLAATCAELRALSSATVTLAYERGHVAHSCAGMGIIVPRGEATRLLAVSWVTSKWAARAPRDSASCSAPSPAAPSTSRRSTPPTRRSSRAPTPTWRLCSACRAPPVLSRVYRWIDASPQDRRRSPAPHRPYRLAPRRHAGTLPHRQRVPRRRHARRDRDARATADRVCGWLDRGAPA